MLIFILYATIIIVGICYNICTSVMVSNFMLLFGVSLVVIVSLVFYLRSAVGDRPAYMKSA